MEMDRTTDQKPNRSLQRRNLKGISKEIFSWWSESTRPGAGVLAAVIVVALIFTVVVAVYVHSSERPNNYYALFVIAIGALAAGSVLGFISAPFGDEDRVFSSYSAVINTALTGSAVTDMLNPNGYVRSFLHSTAHWIDPRTSPTALVLLVIVAFAPLGFIAMYLFKRTYINPLFLWTQREMDVQSRSVFDTRAASFTERVDGEATLLSPDEPKPFESELQERAARMMQPIQAPDSIVGVDDIVAYAKALCICGKAEEAIRILHKRSLGNEDNATLMLCRAILTLFYDKNNKDRFEQATVILNDLCGNKGARLIGWKLLGYACLRQALAVDTTIAEGVKNNLAKEAERATQAYIDIRKDYPEKGGAFDSAAGAVFNLACSRLIQGDGFQSVKPLLNEVARIAGPKKILDRLGSTDHVAALLKKFQPEFQAWADSLEWWPGTEKPIPAQ